MMAEKNCLPLRRKGREKGSLNKTTKRFNEALLTAAEQAGSQYGEDGLVSYLQYHALNNPVPFFSLLAKVLPLQVTGEAGGEVKTISRIEIVPVKPKNTEPEKQDFEA
ncbi:phage protein [Bartonella kosoyi]|uniref:Phage protein n=2 Tax=Bartonella kosoyi TaxID=2133959 RepID=A0A5B9CYG4_9HYPH|nr:phage protein [Bartonella kosoyi]